MGINAIHQGSSATPRPGLRGPLAVIISIAAALCAMWLALVLISGLTTTGNETREQQFSTGATPRVVVRASVGGKVTVQPGATDGVSVWAELRDQRRIDYDVRQSGDTIEVDAGGAGGLLGFMPSWRRSANVAITVPPGADVDVETGDGDIEAAGLNRTGRLQTSNGSVWLRNARGTFNIGASNGDIEVDGLSDTATLRTSNGTVRLWNVQGAFDVSTSNGDIRFDGALPAGSQTSLKTSNGSVAVRLQGAPSVRVDASTGNGMVTSELPVLTVGGSERRSLTGVIGDGQAELQVRTSNGDVAIK